MVRSPGGHRAVTQLDVFGLPSGGTTPRHPRCEGHPSLAQTALSDRYLPQAITEDRGAIFFELAS